MLPNSVMNVSIYFPLLKKDDFFILEFFVGHVSWQMLSSHMN